ncbi:DUF3881 family protein [Vallitalea pronyensis]|uniref:DUF3881 family protein n=1 Tax=Vallitalea pronyensis TaxID=1348613 RepID=A0A8J8MH25_9FIRM|nr:DUF3881 family protein [Vallitalea pronyensis]QUI21113.1 DUF3881 family protein [Vallitalea pronyensis]
MEKYLSAIGFKGYANKEQIKELVRDIIQNPTEKYISNFGKEKLKVEYHKKYQEELGIMVRGELDDQEEIKVSSVLPYKKGTIPMDVGEIDVIEADFGKDEYYGFFEDDKTGNAMTFYLQNLVDYFDIGEERDVYIRCLRLVAFSIEGTVILPISKDEVDIMVEEEEEKWRASLLEMAKDGDEEAISLLEIDAEQTEELFQYRTRHEDLLTILEGYFIPHGFHESEYSLLGTILDSRMVRNTMTGEEVYILDLDCLNFRVEVCINKKDLMGIPSKGMRFKGVCMIQGHIEFV